MKCKQKTQLNHSVTVCPLPFQIRGCIRILQRPSPGSTSSCTGLLYHVFNVREDHSFYRDGAQTILVVKGLLVRDSQNNHVWYRLYRHYKGHKVFVWGPEWRIVLRSNLTKIRARKDRFPLLDWNPFHIRIITRWIQKCFWLFID